MEGQASQAGWTSWLDKLARELARENLARKPPNEAGRTELAGKSWLGTGWRELSGNWLGRTGRRELASEADQASRLARELGGENWAELGGGNWPAKPARQAGSTRTSPGELAGESWAGTGSRELD